MPPIAVARLWVVGTVSKGWTVLIELHSQECAFGANIAKRIVSASGEQWVAIVHELTAKRQLNMAVRQINLLLEDPEREDLARLALKRIGLAHGG